MRTSQDDFWLQVHDLSLMLECADSELPSRIEKLAVDFAQYPPIARRQLGEEFRLVAATFRKLTEKID